MSESCLFRDGALFIRGLGCYLSIAPGMAKVLHGRAAQAIYTIDNLIGSEQGAPKASANLFLGPKPQPLNPKPLNPKPLNPKPLNPKP